MYFNALFLLGGLFLGHFARAQTLDHPALRDSLDAFQPGLQAALSPPSYTVDQWPAGTIAANCKSLAEREGLNPAQVTTYGVTYADCSLPWLLCRHSDATGSIDDFIANFGRVPVRMRQFTAELLLRPDTSLHAYALGNLIVVYREVPQCSIMMHEVTHTMDYASAFAVEGQLSSNQVWLDAYNADSAVPDNYARSSQAENLAQFPQLVVYNERVSGGIASIEPNVARIANQLATTDDQAYRGDYGGMFLEPSNTCSARYANSDPVSVSSVSRVKGSGVSSAFLARYGVEGQKLVAARMGIPLMNIPSGSVEATNCTFSPS